MDTLVAKFSLEEPMPDLQDLIARWPRHGQLGQACGRHTTRTSKRRRLTLAVLLIVDCRQAARSQILEAAKARFRDGFGKARDHENAKWSDWLREQFLARSPVQGRLELTPKKFISKG